MQLIIHTPINPLSLGQVGYNLLRECYLRNYNVGWFQVGDTDLSAFKPDPDFFAWLDKSARERFSYLGHGFPALVNWHIASSERLYSDKQVLLTYQETSQPTPTELSIVKNQYKSLFCGGYSESVFRKAGAENVGSFNLGLDPEIFPTGKKYLEGRINFGLIGKWEFRKNTEGILKAWVKRFGNDKRYSLTCLIENPFLSQEDNQKLISNALGGRRVWNCNFLPRLKTNAEMNLVYNSIDIDLSGASFAEAWGLPAFNATCLGKWSIVTNYGGHKAWANSKNSILIEPDGTQDCYDDIFFKKGNQFNQGQFSNYSEDKLIASFEEAISKVGTFNENGFLLREKFTYSKALDLILE